MKAPFFTILSSSLLILFSACEVKEEPQNLSVDEGPKPSKSATSSKETATAPQAQPELKTLTDLEYRNGKYFEKGGEEPISGKFQAYHKNGELMSESHYVNGLKEGVEKGWDPYGKLRLEAHFKNGKSHGVSRNWHPNGQLMNETNFVNGLTHGLSRTWYSNGNRNTETEYNFQKIEGYSRSWHSNGNKRSDAQYRNGQRHGMFYEWNEAGTLIRQERYVDGEHVETLVEPPVVEEPQPEDPPTISENSTPDVPEVPEPPKDVIDFIAKGDVQVVARESGTNKVILSKAFKEGEKVSLPVKGKLNLLLSKGDQLTLSKGDFKTDTGGGTGIANFQMSLAEDGSIILTEFGK